MGRGVDASVSFVEDRLRTRQLDARQLLAEALLDLGLLAQADALLGSMFSNFARLALSLGGSLIYRSFDALWCPYHLCQAGAMDLDRLCWTPQLTAGGELNLGAAPFSSFSISGRNRNRGGHPRGGHPRATRERNAPLAAPAPRAWGRDSEVLQIYLKTPPARRAWIKLMLQLRAIPTDLPMEQQRNACKVAFEREAPSLMRMPAVY